MKRVKVPMRYNYIATFLSLRCNLDCSYCLNKYNGEVRRNRFEMSAHEWYDGLNRLKIREDLPITLEGGEPTLHKGFYDIIRKVKHPIDILTNLQFDVDEFIERVDPNKLNRSKIPAYKSIRAAYHAENMDLENTIEKTVKLQDAGFNIGLFVLNLPEATEQNMKMAELARQNKIYFFIKDFLGKKDGRLFGHYKDPNALDKNKKQVMCRLKELIIDPIGLIYRCHRDLYKEENPLGHLSDDNLEIKDIFRICKNYGECNPCDAKLRTNRFLQMGSCQMQIKND